jgi:hypothetical protein
VTSPRAANVALAGLFMAGVLHWLAFFGTGAETMSFTAADWPKEFRYYSAVKQAVTEGRVPYYVSRPIHETRKLLALPELSWSPQIALLRVVDVPAFFALNTALLFAAGFAGCLVLRRRYELSFAPFALLVMVALVNGHLAAHLGVGHSMWTGAFLLPWVAVFALELAEEPRSRRATLLLALVLFAILLQGSFHVFVWCLMLLGLIAAFEARARRAALAAGAWAVALGACRLLPAAAALGGRREQPFLSGYPTPAVLLEALVRVRTAAEPPRGGRFDALGWWEYDAFVGAAALVWLLWFGVYRRWRARNEEDARAAGPGLRWRRGLDGPLAVLALLSLGDLYYPINASGIPLLAAERVSSRFLLVPLVFLAVFAAARTEADLRRARRPRRLRALVGLAAALTAVCLAVHSWTWRAPAVVASWPPAPHERVLAIELQEPANEGARDRTYMAAVRLGAAASLGALIVLGSRLWRLRTATSPGAARAPSG